MLLGVQLFGRDIPAFVVFLILAVLVIGYFAATKGMPQRVGFKGHGRMYRCERCGYDFQFERVEEMSDGSEHMFRDDRCPNCGWDQDRDNPDSPFN